MTVERKKRTKELDLLFGAVCPDCGKLITVLVRGKPDEATAIVRYGMSICAPAPIREPVREPLPSPPTTADQDVKLRYLS
jgi:hypothetical protein